MFSSGEPVTASKEPETLQTWTEEAAADLEACVCACPSDLPKLYWIAAQRAQPLILLSKPLIVFWNSLRE